MTNDDDWLLWKAIGQVNIYTASAEPLLVMNAAAARPKKDGQDLIVLLRKLNISKVEEVAYLYEKYFPGDVLPEKAHRLLNVLLSEVG